MSSVVQTVMVLSAAEPPPEPPPESLPPPPPPPQPAATSIAVTATPARKRDLRNSGLSFTERRLCYERSGIWRLLTALCSSNQLIRIDDKT